MHNIHILQELSTANHKNLIKLGIVCLQNSQKHAIFEHGFLNKSAN
jgi:hypothetical protein